MVPCHSAHSPVHVVILLMLIRVMKQDWTQMSNGPSTTVEVHGKTPGNYTIRGIFGLRTNSHRLRSFFT